MNPQGQVYIPSKIREATGLERSKEIILIGNARSIFIIPANLSSEEALKSLSVISKHLEHEAEIEMKE